MNTNIQMIEQWLLEQLVELNQCGICCPISELQSRLLMHLNSLKQGAFSVNYMLNNGYLGAISYGVINNLFRPDRHLTQAKHYRLFRDSSFVEWNRVTHS
jgi:hypothetical protein